MIEGNYQLRDSKPGAVMKVLNRLARGQIRDMRFWVVVVVVIISFFLFWSTALIYAYVADDLSLSPADERSVPAPRSY